MSDRVGPPSIPFVETTNITRLTAEDLGRWTAEAAELQALRRRQVAWRYYLFLVPDGSQPQLHELTTPSQVIEAVRPFIGSDCWWAVVCGEAARVIDGTHPRLLIGDNEYHLTEQRPPQPGLLGNLRRPPPVI